MDNEHLKTLEWKPLIAGSNNSGLLTAHENGKTYFVGGRIRNGKLQVNVADMIEVDFTTQREEK